MRILRGHFQPAQTLAYSTDGALLASADGAGTTFLWDAVSGEMVRRLPGYTAPLFCVCFSPDGRFLATGGDDHHVRVWSVEEGRLLGQMRVPGFALSGLAFSADGRWLVASVDARRPPGLWLWPVLPDHVQFETGPAGADGLPGNAVIDEYRVGPWRNVSGVWGLALGPDGHRLLIGAGNGEVQLWDLRHDIEPVRRLHQSTASRAVAISTDGRVLAALPGELVQLWDSRNLDAPPRTLRGHGLTLSSLAFTPDSRYLATGCWDSTVRLWDVLTGAERRRYDWQLGRIHAVAIAPDGMTAAVAGRESRDLVVFDLDL